MQGKYIISRQRYIISAQSENRPPIDSPPIDTDAYFKAKDQVAIQNRQTENEAAHNGIRELGEGGVPEAMTNDDKKKMWGDNPIQL